MPLFPDTPLARRSRLRFTDPRLAPEALALYPSGEYVFDNQIDLGRVYTVRLEVQMVAFAFLEDGGLIDDQTADVDDWLSIDEIGEGTGNVTIFISQTDDDPDASPAWTDYQPFTIGDYTGRAFRFKALLEADEGSNVVIQELSVRAAAFPRVQAGTETFPSGTSGSIRIDYTSPFVFQPIVMITAFSLASTDEFVLTAEDVDGFNIRFQVKAGGGNVATTYDFNWTATGN